MSRIMVFVNPSSRIVEVKHFKPHLLPADSKQRGIYVEESQLPPEPLLQSGKAALLRLKEGVTVQPGKDGYQEVSGSDFEYVLVDRPATPEESLQTALAAIMERLDTIDQRLAVMEQSKATG